MSHQVSKAKWIISAALLAAALPLEAQTTQAAKQEEAEKPADWRETYAYTVGMQAVIYGFPVVKNMTARHGMIEKPIGQADMPLNTWFHSRRASDATDKLHSSVTPDLLYSAAWFDVRKEPVVLTVPDSPDLYYSVQFMEMYSDIFAYLGTRATGGKAGKHLLVSADWQGERPTGIESVIRAPQDGGLLLLRTAILDRKVLTASHKVQDGVGIATLSKWLRADTTAETDREVIDPAPLTTALPFFASLNRGMTENPPPAKDAAFVAMMASVGLGPGQSSDFAALDPATRKGLQRAMVDGLAFLKQVSVAGGNTKFINQWAYGNKAWGRTAETHDLLTRSATQSLSGMQEHHIEEVVKLRTHHDGDGQLLDGGTGRYTISFAPGQLPKAKTFWSIVVYDEQYDLVDNPLGRYSRGSVDREMKYHKDGGLTLYLQADTPAKKLMGNWLPIPKGKFNLFLRSYLPGQDLIDQSYVPPIVRKIP
ncbi:MAG: DUF1254 domain-containing protein [Sphingorhabdus sp.]